MTRIFAEDGSHIPVTVLCTLTSGSWFVARAAHRQGAITIYRT